MQPDLGQEFLQEMERERIKEEDQQYRQTLHRLWDKFHQQENSIERQLFEEQLENPDVDPEEEEEEERKRQRSFDVDDRKKRYGFLPMYFGPMPVKRRDYPLLPWLVNDDDDARKKRFMVRKRSAKPMAAEEARASGTNEKVAKDLQSLFGAPEEKKKRSTEEAVAEAEKKAPEAQHKIEKKSAHGYEDPEEEEEEDDHEHEHEDHDHDHDTEDVHDHDHDGSSEESDDDQQKKKKRDVSVKSAPEVVKDEQIIPGDLSDFAKKKDAGWERYFGYDRRKKKSVHWAGNGKYDSMMRQPPHGHEEESDEKRKGKQMDPEKLESMDEKLKNIEDLIIEETVKYTGAHEGVSRPEQIQQLKDHVISRLATAYSLEKMRRALDQLRENVDTERHLLHNEIEHPRDHGRIGGEDDEGSDSDDDKKKKKKRVAVKKDQTEAEVMDGGHR